MRFRKRERIRTSWTVRRCVDVKGLEVWNCVHRCDQPWRKLIPIHYEWTRWRNWNLSSATPENVQIHEIQKSIFYGLWNDGGQYLCNGRAGGGYCPMLNAVMVQPVIAKTWARLHPRNEFCILALFFRRLFWKIKRWNVSYMPGPITNWLGTMDLKGINCITKF